MATSSITKEFVLKDDKACDRLIKVINEQSKRKKPDKSIDKYQEGKRKLAQYFGL